MPDLEFAWVNLTLTIGGETIEIGKNKTFNLVSIEGIENVENEFTTAGQAIYDGDVLRGVRVPSRMIMIEADYTKIDAVRGTRNRLISFFKPREKGTLTVDYMGIRRKIDCYVNSFSCGREHIYEPLPMFISLYCPNPYFRDAEGFSKNVAEKRPLLRAPFAIPYGKPFALSAKLIKTQTGLQNTGDKETGVIINFIARGEVVNPRIESLATGEYIMVNYNMQLGDSIKVSTMPGQKWVRFTGMMNGEFVENKDIIHMLDIDSTFFQMEIGENILKYDAEYGYINLDVFLSWNAEYLGV